jgi:hypothetical protein
MGKVSRSAKPESKNEHAGPPGTSQRLTVVAVPAEEAEVSWTLQHGFLSQVDSCGAPIISRHDLSAFRGRVFYADGRRPQFLSPGGEYADEDEHDAVAFHLIGTVGAHPIAACRLVRFRDVARTDFERRIDSDVIDRMLARLNVGRGDTVEVSRWVVDPRFRQERLGASLIAGLWAFALHLGVLAALAWAGTRDGQARALIAMGGSPISGMVPMKSMAWDDDLQALSFDPSRPAPRFRPWVNRMNERLGFGELSWAR